MKQKKQTDKKVSLSMRHTPSVKEKVDNMAFIENVSPSVLYRKIFNAGLTALYGIKIQGNKILD